MSWSGYFSCVNFEKYILRNTLWEIHFYKYKQRGNKGSSWKMSWSGYFACRNFEKYIFKNTFWEIHFQKYILRNTNREETKGRVGKWVGRVILHAVAIERVCERSCKGMTATGSLRLLITEPLSTDRIALTREEGSRPTSQGADQELFQLTCNYFARRWHAVEHWSILVKGGWLIVIVMPIF